MKGSLHGIWFTNSGRIHPKVIELLPRWARELQGTGLTAVLWTNKASLDKDTIAYFERNNVKVCDYSLCEKSKLYYYFLYFFEKGQAGDITAFALASDILRMAILDGIDEEEYYIYADPNDTEFDHLGLAVSQLERRFARNTLGFAYPIHLQVNPDQTDFRLDIRNDVLIAFKKRNPAFFRDFLECYKNSLELRHSFYLKPRTVTEAINQALTITNCTYGAFFTVTYDEASLQSARATMATMATFGPYRATWADIFTRCYLAFTRIIDAADTWYPVENALQESLGMPQKTYDREQPSLSDQMVWISTEVMNKPSIFKFFQEAEKLTQEEAVGPEVVLEGKGVSLS